MNRAIKYAAAAGPATVLVFSSGIVSTFLAPLRAAYWDRRTRMFPQIALKKSHSRKA